MQVITSAKRKVAISVLCVSLSLMRFSNRPSSYPDAYVNFTDQRQFCLAYRCMRVGRMNGQIDPDIMVFTRLGSIVGSDGQIAFCKKGEILSGTKANYRHSSIIVFDFDQVDRRAYSSMLNAQKFGGILLTQSTTSALLSGLLLSSSSVRYFSLKLTLTIPDMSDLTPLPHPIPYDTFEST